MPRQHCHVEDTETERRQHDRSEMLAPILGKRRDAAGREPVAVDREEEDQHDGQPEARDAHPQDADEPGAVVDHAVAQHCRQRAKDKGDHDRYREGDGDQFQRHRQRGRNLAVHAQARGKGDAEIAVQHDALQPVPVLHQDRAIETVVAVELRDLPIGRRVLAEDDACRTVWNRAREHEQHQAHQQERQQRKGSPAQARSESMAMPTRAVPLAPPRRRER